MTVPSNGHTETDRHVKFDTAEPGIEFYFVHFFIQCHLWEKLNDIVLCVFLIMFFLILWFIYIYILILNYILSIFLLILSIYLSSFSHSLNIFKFIYSSNLSKLLEPSGRRRAKTLSTSCGESLKKELKYKKMTR